MRLAVWGSVRQKDSSLLVRVGLVDTDDDRMDWVGDYVPNGDVANGLDSELSQRIARDLQVAATYAVARDFDEANISRAPLPQLIAKALTLQYRAPIPDDEPAALALYNEALRRDPNSAF